MKKLFCLIFILLSGMLCLVGCLSDEETLSNSSDENSAFSRITPSGIKQIGKYVNMAQGTTFTVRCDSIPGALNYTFTTSFGASLGSSTPVVSIKTTVAQGDKPYTLSVYATNGDGVHTKTGSATVN